MWQAEFRHEGNFFAGRRPRHLQVRGTQPFNECARDPLGQCLDIVVSGVHDTHQSRETEGAGSKKAVAEGLLYLARQIRRRNVGKTECADKRPFAFLGR